MSIIVKVYYILAFCVNPPVIEMLDTKIYSRQELIDLFKTERIDSIKNKLQRQGYQFETSGRGKDFTLTITEQPLLPFRTFAIEELGFSPQTDFDRLEIFLYRFYLDKEFQKLPSSGMVDALKNDGVSVTYQTIERWIDRLIKSDFIIRSNTEFNYYAVNHHAEKLIKFIDRTTYAEAWKAYWSGCEYSYYDACSDMYAVAKGTPHKVGVIYENDWYSKKKDELIDILQVKERINGESIQETD